MQPDLDLVGTAATPHEGVDLFAEMRPDLTLMDLDRPSDGLKAIRRIMELDPSAWVIALLTNDWDDSGAFALQAGATAILTKDLIRDKLLPLIRAGRPIDKGNSAKVSAYPLI